MHPLRFDKSQVFNLNPTISDAANPVICVYSLQHVSVNLPSNNCQSQNTSYTQKRSSWHHKLFPQCRDTTAGLGQNFPRSQSRLCIWGLVGFRFYWVRLVLRLRTLHPLQLPSDGAGELNSMTRKPPSELESGEPESSEPTWSTSTGISKLVQSSPTEFCAQVLLTHMTLRTRVIRICSVSHLEDSQPT